MKRVGPEAVVDFRKRGVERFRTKRKLKLCIEGQFYPWSDKIITTEQIAKLGNWDPSAGVIEVDKHQNERTLDPGEVIKLRPGLIFGKRVCWKRGFRD